VLLSADFSSACKETHARNLPHIPFLNADLSEISGHSIGEAAGVRAGELDLLIGGPPCQGFSILGQRENDDPRNNLVSHFFRIAADLRPKIIAFENVPGMATLGGGIYLRQVAESFRSLGYQSSCAELLAAQYGVPQMRWRMLFLGVRVDSGLDLPSFPAPTHGNMGIGDLVSNRTIRSHELCGFLTVRDAIGDLPPVAAGEYQHTYTEPPSTGFQRAMRARTYENVLNHYAPRMSRQNLARFSHLKPGQDWRDLPEELLPAGMRRAHRKDHTRRYRRMCWDGVPRSIITRFRDPKSGEYIHPDQDRTISIREAARIQSFPDWFEFRSTLTSQYEQVGNAVPPLLAKALAQGILKALRFEFSNVPFKSRYALPAD
jgi:DNA (cytosine-5)-methyltransferase 1